MKKILFALSLLACAAAATANDEVAAIGAYCISFAPAGYIDGMQYDSARKATWINYDGVSDGKQTTASWKKGTTTCVAARGCKPAAGSGWDQFNWKFNKSSSTGTLTGVIGGVPQTLLQDIPVAITSGACNFIAAQGGVTSLPR
jgi:hypothetical protein